MGADAVSLREWVTQRELFRQMNAVALGTVSRSGLIEATHYGHVAIADASGALVASAGDPYLMAFMRSSSKPLQALLVVQSGAADEFAFSQRELSICCASHCGSAEHVTTVRGILEKLDLTEDDLECGTHWPGDTDERNRLIRENAEPGPAHNNCSGKHAGMLAAARAMGVPTKGYSQREHPIQQAHIRNIRAVCDLAEDELVLGIDGCGVPTFGMPLRNMATGYARLVDPVGLDAETAAATGRIRAAMAAEPVMVSGRGSFNSELLSVAGDRVTCKGGAEGLFMLCVAGENVGIAVKQSDGGSRVQAPVVMQILTGMGVLDEAALARLEPFAAPRITNCHGTHVGDIESVLELG